VPYWGRGYATEAARAIVDFAFGELGLNRVFAYHFTSNPASGRVLQNIGMRLEGLPPAAHPQVGRVPGQQPPRHASQ
jgi:RimJ/RimL family protein N-acetyltransferase